MTFLAVLSKELRTRMRRERTIWLLIIYILILGLAGCFIVNNANGSLETVGTSLYYFLSMFQLILIIFTVPAFTATAINGEKERQTYDLLICSGMTGFSIIMGKLIAGMTTVLLLIGASIPLFSLFLFFGGIAPTQLPILLLIYLVTALFIGSFSIFYSIILRRPAVSTALSYMFSLIWCTSPLLMFYMWHFFTQQYPAYYQIPFIYVWSPFAAIISINYPHDFAITIGNNTIILWMCYVLLNVIASAVLVFLNVSATRSSDVVTHWYLWMKRLRSRQIGAAST